ncbi:DENN domain-containing protein 3 isoform X2 [Nothobranchius furzeri]|uniref:DENN domain-containing protein 3 isoform X2 n=1 Tax=Nothobranchius furzeri TaxID=105023 RepID=UPI003904BDA5
MTPALTNVLLMDAVARCLQTQNSISAASKLAYFDKIKHEAPMIVPETTSEALKHKINPSVGLAEPQTVHLLLYPPDLRDGAGPGSGVDGISGLCYLHHQHTQHVLQQAAD